MSPELLSQKLASLTIWKHGPHRAPNKPLLLLLAISRFLNKGERSLLYEEIGPVLRNLLIEFGPSRANHKTTDPFWRLEGDGIWELDAPENIRPASGADNFKKSELIQFRVRGGFKSDILDLFETKPEIVNQFVQQILDEHFPETLHDDIREAVGLQLPSAGFSFSKRKKRDPNFRTEVLNAYGHSCAVCGFQVMMNKTPIALEAAHIRWHQYSGPDTIENGLALCSLHHKLLDKGAFTINSYGIIQVSELAYGNHGFDQWLGKYHDQTMRAPVRTAYEPRAEYLRWHQDEVFKGQPRDSLSR